MASLQNSPNAPPVALVDGAIIALDASLSDTFTVTLAGNRTLANPTNLRAGQMIRLFVTQDATGTRTLAYGTNFRRPNTAAVVLSTIAARTDMLTMFSPDGVIVHISAPTLHMG